MRRHSRGFAWATKPPTGVLQLNLAHALCPTISFPLDDVACLDPSPGPTAINTPLRNLGRKPLGLFAKGNSSGVDRVSLQPTRLGAAADLGGASRSYLEAPIDPLLQPTGAFTFEVWISNTVWDSNTGIAGSWDSNGYMLFSNSGVARAYINGTNVSGATTLPTNALIHLVETYDGTNVKLYLDGREDATGAASGLAASAVVWQAGQYSGGAGGFWTGDARYVMINLWNGRCLGAGDVRERYRNPYGIFKAPRLAFRHGKAAAAGGGFFARYYYERQAGLNC